MRFLGVGLNYIGLQTLGQLAQVPQDARVETEPFRYAMDLNPGLPGCFDKRFDAVRRARSALLRPLESCNRQLDKRTILERPGYSAELEQVLRNTRYDGSSFHHGEDANPASGDRVAIRTRRHAL